VKGLSNFMFVSCEGLCGSGLLFRAAEGFEAGEKLAAASSFEIGGLTFSLHKFVRYYR